ncbi:MAG TPA: hypothetical protein VNS31_11630 [Ramlibacter sp.]|jgi:hypothetical protein|nr:hypothetical protein [Ramlibacter sp.]
MLKKSILSISLLLALAAAQAQTPAPSSPAKKDLVARILKLQQPGIENMARGLVEQPAAELMGNAANALPSRVPKEKQDAVAKEIQGDVQKYLDDAVPLVQARATKLAPSTIGALLEEKFTEDELKQILGIIESPVYTKFQKMGDEMQQQLIEKLVTETRPTIEPKVRALEQTIARRLGVSNPAASGNGAPRAPAKPAAKPASK